MPLTANEHTYNGEIRDSSGRLIVVGPDGSALPTTTTITALTDGTQRVGANSDQVVTGGLVTTGSVVAAVRAGDRFLTINVTNTFVATWIAEYSFDSTTGLDGTFYSATLRAQAGTPATSSSTVPLNAGYSAAIPAGTTFVRVRASAYTSGTVTVRIVTSAAGTDPLSNAVLGAGTSQVGFVQSAGMWRDLSTATLAAAGTFTATQADLTVTAQNSQLASGSTRGHVEFRISAEADVVGTLYLEVSRDNVTFRRVKGVILAAFDGTCGFYGEIIHRPSWRYARAVFVNGAGAQARFTLQDFQIGA